MRKRKSRIVEGEIARLRTSFCPRFSSFFAEARQPTSIAGFQHRKSLRVHIFYMVIMNERIGRLEITVETFDVDKIYFGAGHEI